jgi:RNA polymerase sigma-70 factor, ECF subfamily
MTTMADRDQDADTTFTAAQAGDATAFGALAEPHRRELGVHCYRMVGSYAESEDLVQETFLRAWRAIADAAGRASFRAWLYRIATRACLDHLERTRRVVPTLPDGGALGTVPAAVPWLDPYPQRLLEAAAPADGEPDVAVVARETVELAFLAAIQLLPPRQRAVLVLRDVLGWTAADVATALDTTTASANSALQRARTTVRGHLPARRDDWTPPSAPTAQERAVLDRYVAALDASDSDALATLLRDDVRASHAAQAAGHDGWEPAWYQGRETVLAAWAPVLHEPDQVELRAVATWVNQQPAAATYVRSAGEETFVAFGLSVLRIEDGVVVEVTTFGTGMFAELGLEPTLP